MSNFNNAIRSFLLLPVLWMRLTRLPNNHLLISTTSISKSIFDSFCTSQLFSQSGSNSLEISNQTHEGIQEWTTLYPPISYTARNQRLLMETNTSQTLESKSGHRSPYNHTDLTGFSSALLSFSQLEMSVYDQNSHCFQDSDFCFKIKSSTAQGY